MSKNTRKTLFGILAWLAMFILFFSIFNYFHFGKYAVIVALFNASIIFFAFLLTTSFLFPKYYDGSAKYWYYSIIVVVLYSLVYFLLDTNFIAPLKEGEHHGPPRIFDFLRTLIWTGLAFFVGTSIQLTEHNNELQEREKELLEDKLQTELQLLKSQINPHFLFNAMNNIYSLSYMKSNLAPESILRLSNMLRYVIEDCVTEEVPLQSEVDYIKNYISFQRMKFPDKRVINLNFDFTGGTLKVAPMLFISFIENSFKYSKIEDFENGYIDLSISVKENNKILFSLENSIPPSGKVRPGAGTGIKNTKNRLEIIYPQRHKLEIKEEPDKFLVKLEIDAYEA